MSPAAPQRLFTAPATRARRAVTALLHAASVATADTIMVRATPALPHRRSSVRTNWSRGCQGRGQDHTGNRLQQQLHVVAFPRTAGACNGTARRATVQGREGKSQAERLDHSASLGCFVRWQNLEACNAYPRRHVRRIHTPGKAEVPKGFCGDVARAASGNCHDGRCSRACGEAKLLTKQGACEGRRQQGRLRRAQETNSRGCNRSGTFPAETSLLRRAIAMADARED